MSATHDNRSKLDKLRCHRAGKALALLAVALPAVVGILGLVFDAGFLMAKSRNSQQVVDAAATAAAMELRLGRPIEAATARAEEYVEVKNEVGDATLEINIPPDSGPYAGRADFVEAILTRPYETRFIHVLGASANQLVSTRAVAGIKPSTAGAALVVLDPDPVPLSLAPLPLSLPILPTLTGGLEIEGLGQVRVDGAVLVNTTWGGVDEDGNPAGTSSGPPYGVACMPLLPLTKLRARDIRVAGGVDRASNYAHFDPGEESPLVSNRLPVPDPLADLPVPSVAADAASIDGTYRGTATVIGLPLLPLFVARLEPGVYDWINVVSGRVVFEPGVYIIRGVNPVTGIGLSVVAGEVTANGVMFYVTNSPAFDAASGAPDEGISADDPPPHVIGNLIPSVLINAALLSSSYSPLATGGPFDGMLIYQNRLDRRPIVIVDEGLLGAPSINGTIYAKWGHVIFVAHGTYDARIVAGTVRIVTALGATIAPGDLLPPAEDVYLVE